MLGAAALVSVAACGSGGEPPTSPPPTAPATPVGSYTIQTVNGKTLPATLYADGAYLYEVTIGTIALGSDAKYSITTTYRQTVPGSVETFVTNDAGSWTQTGSSIQLVSDADGTTDSAVWDKGVLTFAESDGTSTMTFVYLQKR